MKRLFICLRYAFTSVFLFVCTLQAVSQTISVNGSVTDENNKALPGVTVQVKNTQKGTTTDAHGKYEINAHMGDSLIFHSIGFNTVVKSITSSILNIQLIATNKALNEIVVLGYGTQKKKDVTAAVSTIDVSKMRDISATNATQFLQGQAPGVQVKQTTGAPGSEFKVTIRGLGSLGATSSPLYVVDGFPIGTNLGQNLNPSDIENITILKDAVSTAIYGARGSNGVVLITTKHAEKGKTNLSASATYGFQNLPDSRRVHVLNGEEFAQFKKESFIDKMRFSEGRDPDISEIPEDYRYPEKTQYSTDWLNEILHHNSPYQKYNVSISDGNGSMHSFISVDYTNQDGLIINTHYKNYSARANIGGKVTDFINFGLNINGSYSNQNLTETNGRGGVIARALLMDPRDPVYNEEGSYNSYIGGHDGVFGYPNLVQYLNEVTNEMKVGDLLSNGFIEFTFLKHFKFKSTINAHLVNTRTKHFTPSTIAGENAPPPNDATESDDATQLLNVLTNQLLTYNNNFGEHHLDALFGYSAQEETVLGLSGSGSEYPNNLTPYLGSAAINSSSSNRYGWSMQAFFTRINYSFKSKYLFSGTFRREGSSRFGLQNKYGNFPALSIGWRISEEPFLKKNNDWLGNLKIRASWGETGNNNIGNYSSLAFMNQSNYILGGNFASGFVVSSFANSDLGWERARQIDLGIDLSAFNNKLTFTVDAYNRLTTDMLLSIQIPAIAGFTSSLGNVGEVRNRGLEFSLGYKQRLGSINLFGNFNISFNRNKILAMRGKSDEIVLGGLYDTYNVSKVGSPIGVFYGYKNLGIFQNEKEIQNSPTQPGAIPGSFKYWDANGDGVIEYDRTDMVQIGNPWPDFIWGATLGANYKNFDITIILVGKQGYDNFSRAQSSTMNMDGVFNVLTAAKYRWRSGKNPGKGVWPTTNFWKWERESNSVYVHDASHMWIKDVTVGYNIPKTKTFPLGFRIFVSADNFILFTNYPGMNPDVDDAGQNRPGYDQNIYPLPRTFSLGVNLNF